MFAIQKRRRREKGAITVAETLIVLAIAATILVAWTLQRSTELTQDNARHTGRLIAAYSGAAALWLTDSPPAFDGDYGIDDLQDCADPDGARFLSCNLSSSTRLPFAFDSAGEPVSLGDLSISVTLGASGARGEIDFGVIRSGRDDDDDGLPDSRPDLAAIAYRTASEETGAGVSDFFELRFARVNPAELVFERADPSFDQTEIDDLARLQAFVGASVDAPFLRTDGSNEMRAGITFINGVTVSPEGSDLGITGGGITAPKISATGSLTVEPVTGVRGAGFQRLDQSLAVAELRAGQETNRVGIEDNRTDVDGNLASIATIETNVETNLELIQANQESLTAAHCKPTRAMALASLPEGIPCNAGYRCVNKENCRLYTAWSQGAAFFERNIDTGLCESGRVSVVTRCTNELVNSSLCYNCQSK